MKKLVCFGAGNTCQGFKNYFDNIYYTKDDFVYILKGGPGTGKSSFMKKIGEYFENQGYNIEYFYCSSDMESLDGVRIVEKKISIVDGTAPHVTEASIPQVKEKIVNIGDFIGSGVKENKEEIENLLSKKSLNFKLGYGYLSCVGELVKLENLLFDIDKNEVEKQGKRLLSKLGLNKTRKKGKQRKLFLSYLGANGIETFQERNNFKKIVNLNSDNYFIGVQILNYIANYLQERKIEFVSFLSLLDCCHRESIYVNELDILIVNNIWQNSFENKKIMDRLLTLAGQSISNAKIYHKKVEEYYIRNMDFKGIDKLREKIIKEIESN